MGDLDFMDLAVLKDQVFPQIVENHIKELNFKPIPERKIFIMNESIQK